MPDRISPPVACLLLYPSMYPRQFNTHIRTVQGTRETASMQVRAIAGHKTRVATTVQQTRKSALYQARRFRRVEVNRKQVIVYPQPAARRMKHHLTTGAGRRQLVVRGAATMHA